MSIYNNNNIDDLDNLFEQSKIVEKKKKMYSTVDISLNLRYGQS
jgi:hypothetical protein